MPFSSHHGSFVYTAVLALICGPVVMIQPVLHPVDCIQVPDENNSKPLKVYVYSHQMKKKDCIKNSMIRKKVSKNPSHR